MSCVEDVTPATFDILSLCALRKQVSTIEPFEYLTYVLFMDGNNTASVANLFGFSASALVTVSWDGTPDMRYKLLFRRELFDLLADFEEDQREAGIEQPVEKVVADLERLVASAKESASLLLGEIDPSVGEDCVHVICDEDASREAMLPPISFAPPKLTRMAPASAATNDVKDPTGAAVGGRLPGHHCECRG